MLGAPVGKTGIIKSYGFLSAYQFFFVGEFKGYLKLGGKNECCGFLPLFRCLTQEKYF